MKNYLTIFLLQGNKDRKGWGRGKAGAIPEEEGTVVLLSKGQSLMGGSEKFGFGNMA